MIYVLSNANKVKFNQISLMLLTKHYYLSTSGMYCFRIAGYCNTTFHLTYKMKLISVIT